MEPAVTPLRRPSGVMALALFAQLAGISYLIAAALGVVSDRSVQQIAVTAGLAIYGFSRLAAGWGLLRMKNYGSILERASGCIWIAFSVVVVVWLKEGVLIVVLLPGIVISLAGLLYLSLPSTKVLFAGSGVPVSPLAALEWFGVATVLAVLGFITIPNVLTGGGSKQKRTMADMRTIATAWEARATDINRYNAAAMTFPTSGVTIDNLTTFLSPTYVKVFPKKDGWGSGWQFGADQPWASKEPAQVYVIISYGKDRKSQRQWSGGATTNFDCDIVYSNGMFVQYPEGVQQQ